MQADPAGHILTIVLGVNKYGSLMRKTGKHKFACKDNAKQARKDLEKLAEMSRKYYLFLQRTFFTDYRPTYGEIALHGASVHRQKASQFYWELRGMDPGNHAQIAKELDSDDFWKIDLDGLATQVLRTNFAAFVASHALPSGAGAAENLHSRALISMLKGIYESCTGKKATATDSDLLELVEICLRTAGHPIDPLEPTKAAFSWREQIEQIDAAEVINKKNRD